MGEVRKFGTGTKISNEIEKELVEKMSNIDESKLNDICLEIYNEKIKDVKFSSDETIEIINNLFHFNEFHAWVIGEMFCRIDDMIFNKHINYEKYNSMDKWFNEHEHKLDFSRDMARNYMAARRAFDPETLQAVGVTKAALLAKIPDKIEREKTTKMVIKNDLSTSDVKKAIEEVKEKISEENKLAKEEKKEEEKKRDKKINKDIIINNYTHATNNKIKKNQVLFECESEELLGLFLEEVLKRKSEIKKSMFNSMA